MATQFCVPCLIEGAACACENTVVARLDDVVDVLGASGGSHGSKHAKECCLVSTCPNLFAQLHPQTGLCTYICPRAANAESPATCITLFAHSILMYIEHYGPDHEVQGSDALHGMGSRDWPSIGKQNPRLKGRLIQWGI